MKKILVILLFLLPTLLFAQEEGQTTRQTQYVSGGCANFSQDSTLRVKAGKRGWIDQLGDVSTALSATPAWTLENYCSTGQPMPFLRHDQDDYVTFRLQFNHFKALGTSIDLHLHAVPMAATTGSAKYVRFACYTAWVNVGGTLPIYTAVAAGTWSRSFITSQDVDNSQYKEILIDLVPALAAPANETVSSILHVVLIRLGATSGLDTYTGNKTCGGTNAANLGISYVDAHFQVSKLGSKSESSD